MGQVRKSAGMQPGLARLINYHVYIGLCLLGLFFITPAWAVENPLSEAAYTGWKTGTTATSQLYTFPAIQDGSRQVTLTAQAKSTGSFARVLTVNNPPANSTSLGRYFLLNMDASNRTASGTVTFDFSTPVTNLSLAASDIDASTYWDQVTVYGVNSEVSTTAKIIPVVNARYNADEVTTNSSNNALVMRTTRANTTTSILLDAKHTQGFTFNQAVDQVFIEYGNYSPNGTTTVPNGQLIRLTIDALTVPAPPVTPTTNSCPAGDKMYYIGQTAPNNATVLPLAWTAGQTSRNFTFTDSAAGDKVVNISFPVLKDTTTVNGTYATSPYFGSIDSATSNAINLVHASNTNAENHKIEVSINKPITKAGFVTQDVDSATNTPPAYIERVDVSATGGKLTALAAFHNLNGNFDIATAITGKNCGLGQCSITATWGYKAANTPFSLAHSNVAAVNNASAHASGYSDFYFCLAPPKVIFTKTLVGSRAAPTDQFALSIAQTAAPKTVLKTFTTQGATDKITTGTETSGLVTLEPNKRYTLAETIVGGGSLNSYTSQYSCRNQTLSSKTVLPVDGVGSSFDLANLNYGDEITCELTNTTNAYIKGIVFHDIGAAQPHANSTISAGSTPLADVNLGGIDTDTPTANNTNYFNGLYDTSLPEPGIAGATIRLYAGTCTGNAFATPLDINNGATVITTDSTGRYSLVITETIKQQAAAKSGQLCLVETNASGYTIDSSENKRTIVLNTVTPASSFDFGDVLPAYQPLVLRKYQYAHDCSNVTSSLYQTPKASGATAGFTINPITDIKPERCVAYYIAAYNRGNLPLASTSITDSGLTSAGSTSYLYVPAPQALHGKVALTVNKTASNVIDAANRNNPAFYNAAHVAKDITSGTVTTLAKQEVLKLWFNTVFSKGASN
jgi:hypothetical protein